MKKKAALSNEQFCEQYFTVFGKKERKKRRRKRKGRKTEKKGKKRK